MNNYGQQNMSNYLRGLGRAVGFADDPERRRTQGSGEQGGDTEWEAVSHTSSRGKVNILRGARGTGLGGLPPRGGEASPTHRDRQQPWEKGGDNIPREIMQNDAIDIQSNISLGEGGYDQ